MKDIKGFEGSYAITRDGRVWSYPKSGNGYGGVWKKILLQRRGYHCVYLWDRRIKKSKQFFIHQLLAKAYIHNPLGFKEINHKDGNKLNNKLSNLEWSNRSLNMKHAYGMGLLHKLGKGENHCQSKLTEFEVSLIKKISLNHNLSYPIIASLFGVSSSTIGLIKRNRIWREVKPYGSSKLG